jgi:hypothetical protein
LDGAIRESTAFVSHPIIGSPYKDPNADLNGIDPFRFEVVIDCANFSSLKSALRNIITSSDMSIRESDDPGVFAAHLTRSSSDGSRLDRFLIDMKWDSAQPGESVDITVKYELYVFVRSTKTEWQQQMPDDQGADAGVRGLPPDGNRGQRGI